jgi:hypothetical protein
MKSVLGKQKLKYTPLTDITRQDANDLRDHLLSRVSANSAVRMLGVLRKSLARKITLNSVPERGEIDFGSSKDFPSINPLTYKQLVA